MFINIQLINFTRKQAIDHSTPDFIRIRKSGQVARALTKELVPRRAHYTLHFSYAAHIRLQRHGGRGHSRQLGTSVQHIRVVVFNMRIPVLLFCCVLCFFKQQR